MKTAGTVISALALMASSGLIAGGASGPSSYQLWSTFYNPLDRLRLADTLTDPAIRQLAGHLLAEEEYNSFDYGRQWDRETDFYTVLEPLVQQSGRDLMLLRSASVNATGCLEGETRYQRPAALFYEGRDQGHEEFFSENIWTTDGEMEGYRVPREELVSWVEQRQNTNSFPMIYSTWRSAVHAAWRDITRGYFWRCGQIDPLLPEYERVYEEMTPEEQAFYPDQEAYREALKMIEGTPVLEFLQHYRRFIDEPSSETAQYFIRPDTREFVARHTREDFMGQFDSLVIVAQTIIEREDQLLVGFPGGMPLTTPSWQACTGEGALRGALELAEAWLEDSQLSDFAVRNALYYRLNIAARCRGRATMALSDEEIDSIPVAWRDYMDALSLFYSNDSEAAGHAFGALVDSEHPMVADLSSYMAGRSFLLAAQNDWRGYGAPDETIDHDLLAKAEDQFRLHIEQAGRYTDSADGLIRRSAYLAGDQEAYQAGLRRAMDRLLAAQDDDNTPIELLLLLREASRHDAGVHLIDHLHQQMEDIAHEERLPVIERLLEFRAGVQAYASEDWLTVYESMSAADVDPVYPYLVKAARQLEDTERLRAVYERFLEGNTLDLKLAALDYPDRGPAAFFDTDNTELARLSALAHCSVDELRTLVEEQYQHPQMPAMRGALYQTLLQRQDFATLHTLMTSDTLGNGAFEDIAPAISQLASGEPTAAAYISLGNYVANRMQMPERSGAYSRLAEVDPDRYCASGLTSSTRGAQHLYLEAINLFQADDRSEDEARALHYMINCDRRGQRGCWGFRPADAEPAATLFRRLHRKYPNSEWTERTPYYY